MNAATIPAGFWPQIDAQLEAIAAGADTFDKVRAILTDPAYADVQRDITRNGPRTFGPNAAFFAGSGGDATLFGALGRAGWRRTWAEASYYYRAENRATGETLTYIEGDVQRGYTNGVAL